jgi:MFS family permease
MGLQIVCMPLLAADSTLAFTLGLGLQVLGLAASDIAFNLYLLELIPRKELVRFEPLRVFYGGIGWALGPWLGVELWERAGVAPFVLSGAVAACVMAYFVRLGFAEKTDAAAHSANPFRFLARYFSQPRLKLAYFHAFTRSSWWVIFYIYGPIYLVEAGASATTSAAVVSAGNACMFLVRLFGRAALRYGTRGLLICGFAGSSVMTLAVALAPPLPWLIAGLLVLSALATSVIDGVGNMPFLRAVRPLERTEMAAVFMTYRDTSQLVPPGCFSLLLHFIPVHAVFAVTAVGTLALVPYLRFIPRRM